MVLRPSRNSVKPVLFRNRSCNCSGPGAGSLAAKTASILYIARATDPDWRPCTRFARGPWWKPGVSLPSSFLLSSLRPIVRPAPASRYQSDYQYATGW